jgi:hypothetical protein
MVQIAGARLAAYSAATVLAGAGGAGVAFFAAAGFFGFPDLAGAVAGCGLKKPKSNSDESGAFGLTPPA